MVSAVGQPGWRMDSSAARPPGVARTSLRTLAALGRRPNLGNPALRREVAGQFAAELFFAPLLAEMRQFPLGRGLVDGGQTEAIFGQQLDQHIADQVALGSTGLLTEIAERLENRHVAGEQPAGVTA